MKFLDVFFAARPLLHLPVWTVYLITLRHNYPSVHTVFHVDDLTVLICLSALFAGAFYINQVHDYETDKLNGKLGFLQRGLITDRQMMAAFWALSTAALVMGFFISVKVLLVFLALYGLAYAYSAPPFRLKDRPLWGLYANGLAHGYLVSLAAMPESMIRLHSAAGWYLPVYFTITVGAVYVVTTIPDTAGDGISGKRTIAVCMGRRWSLILSGLLMVISALVAWTADYYALTALSVFAALLAIISAWTGSERMVLATAKIPLLLLTLVAGYHYPAYLVFIVALVFATRIYYKKRFSMVHPRLV